MWHKLESGEFVKCLEGVAYHKDGAVFHCAICSAENECTCAECRKAAGVDADTQLATRED